MSEWVFDLGNSRLKYAPLHDGRVGTMAAIDHDGHAFAPDWQERLPREIRVASVASVASPTLRETLIATLEARGTRVRVAATQAACDGLRIAYREPKDLGIDRFLALLAAHARGGDWLVVGVGTALTIDLLDADGLHRGGRIAPSPAMMREALHARAKQLAMIGGDYREFADGTLDGLASGCEGAALGLVERSLRESTSLLGFVPNVLLHGGGAETLSRHLPHATLAPALVLEGLARWSHVQSHAS